MKLDELVDRIRAQEPQALAGLSNAQAARLLRACLKEIRVKVEEASRAAKPAALPLPELGELRPPHSPGKSWHLALASSAAAQPAAPQTAMVKKKAGAEAVLVHPKYKFVLIFSPKSACSTVIIWFFHTLGLADEARTYSEWPHHYRIDKLNRSESQAQARKIALDELKILRVVRDPLDRAGSSFRHALGTGYARAQILEKIGVDVATEGLSFSRFIDFLQAEDLGTCNPHHRRQKHPLEDIRLPDYVINASRQDLFAGLNAFERAMGMPITDFAQLSWVHELQAGRVPHSMDMGPNPDQLVLTRAQAQRGPWPKGLLTESARARLQTLFADDIERYAHVPPLL